MDTNHILQQFLGSLSFLPPIAHANLTLVPVRDGEAPGFPYLVLSEALALGSFRIGERGGGMVPALMLVNESDSRVFLMDGEELVGAKQNRILNTSMLVEAHSEIMIPVSCVEAHRWSAREPWMHSGGISYPKLRNSKARQVSENLRAHREYVSDQGEVWRSVDAKLCALGVHSETASMDEIYTQRRESLHGYRDSLPCPDGASGVIAAIHGRVACADLFDSPRTLQSLWPRLVESYSLDALENTAAAGQGAGAPDVQSFLQLSEKALIEPFVSPGIGTSLRITAGHRTGCALVCDDHLVHLELFGPGAAQSVRDARLSRPSERRGNRSDIVE